MMRIVVSGSNRLSAPAMEQEQHADPPKNRGRWFRDGCGGELHALGEDSLFKGTASADSEPKFKTVSSRDGAKARYVERHWQPKVVPSI